MKAEEVFADELRKIRDSKIKNFVIAVFEKLCPDYFWTVPCSTSDKYHPQVSLGVGGLIRHTKLAVWWGLELIRALGSSPDLKSIPTVQLQDEVIATLLLHDLIKNGKGLGPDGHPLESGITGTHGVTLANKIMLTVLFQHVNSDDSPFFRIVWGIAGHMGIWTTDPVYRPENIEGTERKAFANLIHLADYCASRKVNDIYSKLEKPNGTT